MHARKLPRISEPSFDRDYYDGGGQNDRSSGSSKGSYSSRYSSSKIKGFGDRGGGGSSGGGGNQGGYVYRRSMSPHNNSPRSSRGGPPSSRRDRDGRDYYSNKYNSRYRDRDRDRDRDRGGDRDRCRSPIRSSSNRKWGESASGRGSSSNNRDKESTSVSHEPKVRSVGEWTEHTSSSGKKYYYNTVTEVSQWEKPKEWLDYERNRGSSSSSSKPSCDRRSNNSDRSMRSNRLRDEPDSYRSKDREPRVHRGGDSRHPRPEKNGRDRDYVREDMDISSSRDATPTSENEDSNNVKQFNNQFSAALPQMASHPEQNQHFNHGPPTPTHSEGHDSGPSAAAANNSQVNPAAAAQAAQTQQPLPHSPLLASLKLQPAVISPSLSRLYREELISHVMGWPAETVEKTCQRVNEDHQNISNLAITKVSAELKMARSLVRLADIQATLQEQRIMFLRQHTTDLESIKTQTSAVHSEPPDARSNHHHHHQTSLTAAAEAPTAGQALATSSSTNSVNSVVR